jgi:hypothetical protein
MAAATVIAAPVAVLAAPVGIVRWLKKKLE